MGKQRGRLTRSDRQEPDTRGWPTHEHNMWTPMGHVEQAGNAARALRYNGRHRRFSRIMLAVMVAPLLIGVVATVGLLVHDLVGGSSDAPQPGPPPPVTAPPPP